MKWSVSKCKSFKMEKKCRQALKETLDNCEPETLSELIDANDSVFPEGADD